jgi:hypothetical protein
VHVSPVKLHPAAVQRPTCLLTGPAHCFGHAQNEQLPGQAVQLLRVATEDSVDPGIRTMGAISFKNLVKRSWERPEHETGEDGPVQKTFLGGARQGSVVPAGCKQQRVTSQDALEALITSQPIHRSLQRRRTARQQCSRYLARPHGFSVEIACHSVSALLLLAGSSAQFLISDADKALVRGNLLEALIRCARAEAGALTRGGAAQVAPLHVSSSRAYAGRRTPFRPSCQRRSRW